MPTQLGNRQANVDYLDSLAGFASVRDIAAMLKIPYKTTNDALNTMRCHGTYRPGRQQVQRQVGRKAIAAGSCGALVNVGEGAVRLG